MPHQREEKWEEKKEVKKEPQTLKINPNTYRVKGVSAKEIAGQDKAKAHIKF